jgi:hypothetical protein
MSDPNMKEAALWYADNGIPIFPLHWPTDDGCSCGKLDCQSAGKHPHTPRGFKDATTDPAQIAKWWGQWPNANIGIPTGATSGLLVVDCDPRNGGPENRAELIELFGQIPDTAEVITGGAGRHIYFRYDGGSVPKNLATGIDLKGDGGYIVAPPSLHQSGRRYEVDGLDGAKAFLNIAEIPAWLKEFITATPKGTPLALPGDGEKWEPGERNSQLVSVAGTMRRRGLSREAIEAALLEENRQRCNPPLPASEVRQIAASISRYEPGSPTSVTSVTDVWPDLVPFDRTAPDQIPANCLPEWLGEMAVAVAENTETPLALAGLLSIAMASACVAGKADISPEPGYTEPLNVFVAPTMESGNRKTAVFQRLMSPVIEWERAAVLRIEPERERLQSQRRTLEARIDGLRRKTSTTEDSQVLVQQIQDLEASLPTIPVLPRLFSDDITPEKLASMMKEQDERMAVFSDEGGVFETLAGRYSQGVPNLDLWLKGHAGSPVRVDRQDRTKPPILMNRPTLTVGVSPQPDVLVSLKNKPGFRGRGLLARFLYALPSSRLGYRTLNPTPIPADIDARYRNGIRQLLDYRPEVPLRLTLTPSAYREWKDFQRALEPQFREGGQLENLKDWGGKLAGAAARLAGIYHMIEQAGNSTATVQLSKSTMEEAIELATRLISHAQQVFALMDRDPALDNAEKVVSWIARQGTPAFTVRDCFRAHQERFQRVDAMLPTLTLLQQHGYIRRVPRGSAGGRPPSDLYEVNPALLNGVAQ